MVAFLTTSFFIVLFVILPTNSYARNAVIHAREDLMLAVSPSAARAYAYGIRHLDARHAVDYDFERAAMLFTKAHEMDPRHPYVYHALARIAFLRGDLDAALGYIDAQIRYHSDVTPASYYMRGLIKGFMKDYNGAADDYGTYLELDPTNWAAATDRAWVLLQAGRPHEALSTIDSVYDLWRTNPWILNMRATALYETGDFALARETALEAARAVAVVTEEEWLRAYPGNDPLVAADGILQFQEAVRSNVRRISDAAQPQ